MTTDSVSLVSVLRNIGVDIRRSDGKEIQGRCPVHLRRTGREDRSPSWSMNAQTGLWICFSCQARGSLPMLVQELTGSEEDLLGVHTMLIDAGLAAAQSTEKQEHTTITNDDLLRFGRFTDVPKEQAKRRNLSVDLLRSYNVRWDTDTRSWVLPITTHFGELLGWQHKGKGWVRNHPEGVEKRLSLFGFTHLKGNSAVLVESPLDVIRFACVFESPQAVASYGVAVSKEQIRLLNLAVDKLIVAMDNDNAGRVASKRFFKELPNFSKGVWYWSYKHCDAKDIGEMSSRQIEEGLYRASLIPFT